MGVPKAMQDKYDEIALIITEFCENFLDDEYNALSLQLLEKLCRKRPSPLMRGNPNTWACGIVYAIGSTNFLFDKSQKPHMRAGDLAEKFGLSPSTAGNKSGEICKLLGISPLDPEWTLPSRLVHNPMVWMFKTSSGFIVDVRREPRDVQAGLFAAGKIPFIPADVEPVDPHEASNESCRQQEDNLNDHRRVITLKVKRANVPIDGQISFDDVPPEE